VNLNGMRRYRRLGTADLVAAMRFGGMTDTQIIDAVAKANAPLITDADRQAAVPADAAQVSIGEMTVEEVESLIARATWEPVPVVYPIHEERLLRERLLRERPRREGQPPREEHRR